MPVHVYSNYSKKQIQMTNTSTHTQLEKKINKNICALIYNKCYNLSIIGIQNAMISLINLITSTFNECV